MLFQARAIEYLDMPAAVTDQTLVLQLLCRRDGVDPRQLLTMATTWGAEAIGMSPLHFQLKPGLPVIDLIGIMASERGGGLAAALNGSALPELLLDSN